MSRNEKLLSRLLSVPKDFTWDELISLLAYYDYKKIKSGKTGGSRRKFADAKKNIISLHEPHPSNVMKGYAIRDVIEYLKTHGHIKDE
ncbi:type II toxin-antitoxin system HicA family toxin [Pedobacter changchengzhani]|uniref:Type II toxin-antitoxin system HicA family toxin n=1 Tax=Pedobacter changchengzhani TaxID=2529274 RepID=A0A4R5MLH1_9SPHI|nr:type II toxin-antitoxin system HicA family toxin [Pedobacter changchengzhani]TDG35949.1 type II toxin-antitoxin system HicA family toxin [Pedobacter changchengzhani]